MSIIYLLIFKVFFPELGYFELGRFIDLALEDIKILFLILIMCYTRRIVVYAKRRWDYIKANE